jgi:hypothetical protein
VTLKKTSPGRSILPGLVSSEEERPTTHHSSFARSRATRSLNCIFQLVRGAAGATGAGVPGDWHEGMHNGTQTGIFLQTLNVSQYGSIWHNV